MNRDLWAQGYMDCIEGREHASNDPEYRAGYRAALAALPKIIGDEESSLKRADREHNW